MKQYKNILVALDVFEPCHSIVKHAQLLAKHFGSKLAFVYVLPHVVTTIPYAYDIENEINQDAKKRLNEVAKKSDLDAAEVHLLHGNPKDEISILAKELGSDLILIGSHGKHGLELMLGSTANGVLHTAECDVLTVRVDADNKRLVNSDYKTILVATDLEKDNNVVVQRAKEIASSYQARLEVLNVVPNTTATALAYYPNIETELRAEAETQLAKFAKAEGIDPKQAHVAIGLPRAEIVHKADKLSAGLIVIGSHGHHALASAILGSTANAVLHAAKQDILVVRIKQ